MSKASEWADAQRRAEAVKPQGWFKNGCEAIVIRGVGDAAMCNINGHALSPSEALELATWLREIFGERVRIEGQFPT